MNSLWGLLTLLWAIAHHFPAVCTAVTSDSASSSIVSDDRINRVNTVLVTGATGRTGSIVYLSLKELGYDVRAFVRNASKAQDILDCDACDESEGVYVGDITDPVTLQAPMQGVDGLVILTSSYPQRYPNGTWYFPEGGYPKDIDWQGSDNQVKAAIAAGVRHVVLVSSMGTTTPDSFLDKLANGHALFYKLQGEVDLMGSGLPFTIIKPGGLLDDEGGENLLVVGHNDELEEPRVTRSDVAAVVVAALENPRSSKWVRFDLSQDSSKPATGDFKQLFNDARAWGRD